MTLKEQDALADCIMRNYGYDARIADEAARGSAQRAVSRLTQSIADTLNHLSKFDRARFVSCCGFGHLDQF